MEATWLTGPAKNLIEFACHAAHGAHGTASEISIVTFQRGDGKEANVFVDACQKAGLVVHIIHERFALDPLVIPAIRRLVAAQNPDIVQTHSVKSHFLIRLSGAYRQRCWIAFHHGYTWTDLKMTVYNRLDRWSLPLADLVVTVCKPFARVLVEQGVEEKRICIQHNSVKPFTPAVDADICELRKRLKLASSELVLLTIGRMSKEKGHVDLIEALKIVRSTRKDISLRLILVGDGPERSQIESAARKYGMEDWLVCVGQQLDVRPYYSLATIMVLPSHTEGSPNVLLESMAAGVATVATNVGGVSEIVTDSKTALLVEKGNPEAMAVAIVRLIESATLREQLSRGARDAARAYSPEAYCDSVLSLYTRCLAARTT